MKAKFERQFRRAIDLRGMGIDSGALPQVLAGFSATGWKLELESGGKIRMIAVASDPGNEEGNIGYLRSTRDRIRECLECLTDSRPAPCRRIKA